MGKTIFEAYNGIKNELEKAGIEDYVFEAKQIIKHVTGYNNMQILTNYAEELTEKQQIMLTATVKQRLIRYPLQYIFGTWDFYGLPFKVGPGVLVPRADTETLVDTLLDLIKDIKAPAVLDLCSGTGCVAIAAAKNRTDAAVTAVEKYEEAARYIRENVKLNNVPNIRLVTGDVFEGAATDTKYDIIVSNPPYVTAEEMKKLPTEVTYEPATALFGGDDGLTFYRAIVKLYKTALKENGKAAFEIGSTQADAVKQILAENGFCDIGVKKDAENRDRVVFGTLKSI